MSSSQERSFESGGDSEEFDFELADLQFSTTAAQDVLGPPRVDTPRWTYPGFLYPDFNRSQTPDDQWSGEPNA